MQNTDAMQEPQRSRGTAIRWAARILFVACGLMIGLVVASDPRVTGAARTALAQMQAGEEVVARQDTSPALTAIPEIRQIRIADEAPDTVQDVVQSVAADQPERPRVSVMPESTVTVRRLVP